MRFEVRFVGSEEWFTCSPSSKRAAATAQEIAEHAIYLHGLRRPRMVREIRPGYWRGLIGREKSPTVEVRTK